MDINISNYNACCNLGSNIEEIYLNAIQGIDSYFTLSDKLISNKLLRIATIDIELPEITDADYNIRCNQLIAYSLNSLKNEINELKNKYLLSEIGIVVATTNSGVSEYETTHNFFHAELGNPALFAKNYLNLKGFYTTVSTACSSGIKAFSIAQDLLRKDVIKVAIVIGVDSIAKVPLYGFSSLDVLSDKPSNPFSANSTGINIGEAVATFILKTDTNNGIKILGIGENSDTYHLTTPDPNGIEAQKAIMEALKNANLKPDDIDYINLHGTGTQANDIMEANAINQIFGSNTPVSSTKPLTGHCLGAAASIETALCCHLLNNFDGRLYPHEYDGNYAKNLPKLHLVSSSKNYYEKCDICLCNAFGFGGTNAILVLGK